MNNLTENRKNVVMYGLVVLLIIAAFFIGSLWTKVQVMEGGLAPTRVANNNVPNQPGAPEAPPAGDVDPVSDTDWVRGDRNARIALIEYSDLECPYCQSFHPTAQQAVDEYGGEVMWIYRHFPLDQIHSKADKEAEAVECAGKLAGNDGFWALTDKIFEVSPANNGLDLDTLPDLAAEVGINRSAFEACLDSGEMASVVEASYQSGLKAGVRGTPGNILLNTETGESEVIPGAVPFATLQSSIDQMLAE
jgi:protein-disulfide isomerase